MRLSEHPIEYRQSRQDSPGQSPVFEGCMRRTLKGMTEGGGKLRKEEAWKLREGCFSRTDDQLSSGVKMLSKTKFPTLS